MNKLNIYITILLVFLSSATATSFAQTASEAIRYSQNPLGGTARNMGAGGAFGAVGADFGALSTNPAGLGLYRKSEFTITPSVVVNENNTSHFGSNANDLGTAFQLGNIGFVFNTRKPPKTKKSGLITSSIGIGVNQLNSFHDNRYISGTNTENSLVEQLAGQASDNDPGSFTGLVNNAWNSYLFDPIGETANYQGVVQGGQLLQQESHTVSGSLNEFLLGFGLNYNDKVYFGANLSVPLSEYDARTSYTESDESNTNERFQNLSIDETLNTTGYGFQGKFGAIFRATDNIRAGVSIHTPGFLRLTDNYSTNFTANAVNTDLESNDFQEFNFETVNGIYTYKLKTPAKYIGSLALISPKLGGFISIDYELVDYGNARFDNSVISNSDQALFSKINTDISTDYGLTSNFRIGGEFARDIFRLRGGFAFQGAPTKAKINGEKGIQTLTAGAGLHGKKFFMDLAFATSSESYAYRLYENATPSNVTKRHNQIALTVGVRY